MRALSVSESPTKRQATPREPANRKISRTFRIFMRIDRLCKITICPVKSGSMQLLKTISAAKNSFK